MCIEGSICVDLGGVIIGDGIGEAIIVEGIRGVLPEALLKAICWGDRGYICKTIGGYICKESEEKGRVGGNFEGSTRGTVWGALRGVIE